MASIMTNTIVVNGAAAEASQVVAVRDLKRKYIGLYARTGSCKVSLGEVTHADAHMIIAEGNILELAVNTLDKIEFSTTGTVLHVIQDRDSKIVLAYDNLVLTSDGEPLAYQQRAFDVPPVFA